MHHLQSFLLTGVQKGVKTHIFGLLIYLMKKNPGILFLDIFTTAAIKLYTSYLIQYINTDLKSEYLMIQ